MIVRAYKHLDSLIKEHKAILKTKRLQLAVTYSEKLKENQISLSKSEPMNNLIPSSQLETTAKSSKIVRGRKVDTFKSQFVGRPVIGLFHESPVSPASEHSSETHCAPTVWRSRRVLAIRASDGQGGHVPTGSPPNKNDTICLWCHDVAENVGGIDSSISTDEIRSMTTSKSSIEDLDNFTNEEAMPQDSSDESYSSEPSQLPPSEVDPSYQVELTIEVPSSMVEDNHALALVQVLPPDTELSDVPDYLDIYHITITDGSVIDEDPPTSDRSHEDHNYYEEASSLNYDSNRDVLNEEDIEDYNHDHDCGYDPDPPYEDYDLDPPGEDCDSNYGSDPPGEDCDPDYSSDPPSEDDTYSLESSDEDN